MFLVGNVKMTEVFDNPVFSDRVMAMVIDSPQKSKSGKKHKRDPDGLDEGEAEAEEGRIIKRLHVSSAVLALASDVFRSMFSSGMVESKEKEFEIKVSSAKESECLAKLIKMLYTNSTPGHQNGSFPEVLQNTTFSEVLDLLVQADQFQCKEIASVSYFFSQYSTPFASAISGCNGSWPM